MLRQGKTVGHTKKLNPTLQENLCLATTKTEVSL